LSNAANIKVGKMATDAGMADFILEFPLVKFPQFLLQGSMYFFKSIAQRIRGILQGSMARNTLWMLLAKLSSVFMQAASFVLIARSLGTEDYGTFIGITALGAIVVPLCQLRQWRSID
jgi:hypothetical protein